MEERTLAGFIAVIGVNQIRFARLRQKISERTLRELVVRKLEYHGLPIRRISCRLAIELASRRAQVLRRADGPPIVFLAIYRARNAKIMKALVRQIGCPADIRLWALDEVVETLGSLTVGQGPGSKFELLDHLLKTRSVPEGAYVAVADDDVVIAGGTLAGMVKLIQKSDVHLAMPAHSPASHFTYPHTVGRSGTWATLVGFVEIGPLFVVAPTWSEKVLSFPDDAGMGWGVDVDWANFVDQGCRLAVLDRYRMFHAVPPAQSYSQAAEARRLTEALERGGSRTLVELMVRHESWRMWQRMPRWLATGHRS